MLWIKDSSAPPQPFSPLWKLDGAPSYKEGAIPGAPTAKSPGKNLTWESRVYFPAVFDSTGAKMPESALYNVPEMEGVLADQVQWIVKTSQSFEVEPAPEWKLFKGASPSGPIGKNQLGKAAKPWQAELFLIEQRVNATMHLAHALNAFSTLDLLYTLVWDWLSRYDDFEFKGKDRPNYGWNEPDGFKAARQAWDLGMASGKYAQEFQDLKEYRTGIGFPTPPLAPFISYTPFWWIKMRNGFKADKDWNPPKFEIVQPIAKPDLSFDLIPAIAKAVIIGAFTAGLAELAAGAVWGSIGAPYGATGAEAFANTLAGGANAAVSGDNIIQGLASGAVESEAAGEIFNETLNDVLDMTQLGAITDYLDPFTDEIKDILNTANDIKDLYDELGSSGAGTFPPPAPPPPVAQLGPSSEPDPGIGVVAASVAKQWAMPVAIGGLVLLLLFKK